MRFSHFSRFWLFLAIFHVLQSVFLMFNIFPFSCHFSGPKVCISYFPPSSVFLTIFQVIQCLCLIFQVFPCFSPYSRSYCVFFSFSMIFKVFFFFFFGILHDIFYILQCLCLYFHVFHFSCHTPVPTMCISHFPPFSVFLTIFQVIQCLCLIFHVY